MFMQNCVKVYKYNSTPSFLLFTMYDVKLSCYKPTSVATSGILSCKFIFIVIPIFFVTLDIAYTICCYVWLIYVSHNFKYVPIVFVDLFLCPCLFFFNFQVYIMDLVNRFNHCHNTFFNYFNETFMN